MDDDVADAIRRGLRWLERSQYRDGHWQGETDLSSVQATTRSLRAFIGCGFPPDYPVVARARRWLTRPQTDKTYHYFWRLGALAELKGAPDDVIEHDLDVVQAQIKAGLKPDSKLSYHAFLFDCAASADKASRFDSEAKQLKKLLETASLSPTPALWGYVGLERSGRTLASYTQILVKDLNASLQGEGGGVRHLNGLVVETSFFVFNVCRSNSLSKDPSMYAAVIGAVRFILSRQQSRGNWETEPPLSNNDPQCSAYFTGIAVRALAEYVRRYDPTRLTAVFLPDWRLRLRIVVTARWSIVLTLVSLAGLVAVLTVGSNIWGVAAALIGTVAAVVELIAFGIRMWRRRI